MLKLFICNCVIIVISNLVGLFVYGPNNCPPPIPPQKKFQEFKLKNKYCVVRIDSFFFFSTLQFYFVVQINIILLRLIISSFEARFPSYYYIQMLMWNKFQIYLTFWSYWDHIFKENIYLHSFQLQVQHFVYISISNRT